MPNYWMLSALALAAIGLINPAQAEPLSFERAILLAQQQSPALHANTAQIKAAQLSAIPAGELADPKLAVGIENFPVSGPGQWTMNGESMTMQKIGIMQEFTNSDKRQARVDAANAAVGVAQAQRDVTLLNTRRDVALSWITRYYLERKVALLADLGRENRILSSTLGSQVASGRIQPADTVAPRQEAVRLEDLRDSLTRDLTKSKAALRRYVGSDADEPLSGAPPALTLDTEQLRDGLVRRPEWQAFDAQARQASAEIREADAAKKPDWGVELAFERRDPRYGNMVSLQFTFDLPIFSSSRQGPRADAQRQQLSRINAERESAMRERTSELESTLADYANAARQLDRATTTSLPLARTKADLQYTSYRAGKSPVGTLLTARSELLDQRLKIIELEWQRAVIASQLYFTYGEQPQ